MVDNTDLSTFVRWADKDVQKRLRALWLNWYKASRIAEIFGCKASAVSAAAYRFNLPFRPHYEFSKWKPLPHLEIWPPPTCPSTFVIPKYLRLEPRPLRPTPAVICLPCTAPLRIDVISMRRFLEMLPPLKITDPPAVVVRAPEVTKPIYPISTFVIPLYLRLEAVPPSKQRAVIWLPYAEPGQPFVVRKSPRVFVNAPPPWLAPASKPKEAAKPKAVTKPEPAKVQPVPPKWMPLLRKPGPVRLKRGDRVFSEAEDQAQIEEFLRVKGASKIPIGVCVHDVAAGPQSFEDRKAEHYRIMSKQKRWNEFRVRAATLRQSD